MIEAMGTTRDGRSVQAVTLRAGPMRARILTLGAILQDLRIGDSPLTIGHPELAAYDAGPLCYFGAVIGPVAGRVSGATGILGATRLRMEANEAPNALHAGQAGLHGKVWDLAAVAEDRVRLETTADPGEGGLPGARRFACTYTLRADALAITLTAETSAPTWADLTHHAYWRPGRDAGVDGLALQISAARYLPLDAAKLPTGEVAEVANTPLDFRHPRHLAPADRIDNALVAAQAERDLTPLATLAEPGGLQLTMASTAPALVVFTCDGSAVPAGHWHGGAAIPGRAGLALEPQGWPDAPTHPGFPPIVLEPGRVWQREIVVSVGAGDRASAR